MDETTNGRQRPPGPEPTPEGRARLLTALDLERARHPVDPGQLGEYVELLDRDGLAAARAAFPAVAAHLAAGCDACNAEVRELRALSALDDAEDGAGHAPGPDADVRHFTGVPPSGPSGVARAAPSDARTTGTNAAREDAFAAAALRRRQKRVLMTGLTAVAAVAMVIMGASLYALLSLAPRGGPAEIKLIARETVTPASNAPASGSTTGGTAPSATPAPSATTAPPAARPVAAPPTPTLLASPGAGSQAKPGLTGAAAGAGSAAPSGSDCPDSHPVKANRESGIYHLRGGAFYDRTRPEVCYATAEDAERAGYRRSQR